MTERDISDEATLKDGPGSVRNSRLFSSKETDNDLVNATADVERKEVPEIEVFARDDPEDPRNWRTGKKLRVVGSLCVMSFVAVFGSSSYAPGEQQIREMFNVGEEVASLGLTVYVLGFAFGPLVWGPMSEMYGRRLPYLVAWPLLIGVIALSAWINNLPVIMIFRFFTGCFAGCPLNNGSGVISDMYASRPRIMQKAIGFFAFTALSGPVVGSLVGFFVAAHWTDGLWVIRVHWFMVIALWPLALLLPETHGPTILARRAQKHRKAGKSNSFAPHEVQQSMTGRELARKHIGRPFYMLAIEPIVLGAAIWVSLSYSIIYFFFEAFPVVFVEQNHFQFQLGGLPFLGITIGMMVCLLSTDRLTQMSRHVKLPFIDPPGGTPAEAPEAGLKVVLISCILMPISLFWFAWTSRGDVHWISPAIAGAFFGYAMLGTFYSFIAYSTSIFTIYASSATAANTLFRSVVASVFPIMAHPVLDNLQTTWGVSLFGFLSLGLLPIPMIFIRYGPALRERSHFAREARSIIASMSHKEDAEELIVAESCARDETA